MVHVMVFFFDYVFSFALHIQTEQHSFFPEHDFHYSFGQLKLLRISWKDLLLRI